MSPLPGAAARFSAIPAAVLRATAKNGRCRGPAPSYVTRTIATCARRGFASSASSSSPSAPAPSSHIDIASAPVNVFQMNQYAFACTATKEAAIVDCGASTQSELDAFLAWLDRGGYDLVSVLQTHAHLDHVAGLGLLRGTFPKVPILLHERETVLYDKFEASVAMWNFQVEDAVLPRDVTYYDDARTEATVGNLTLEIVPTPGHSPGHVAYYEPKSKSFFGGDLIMKGSIGRTDFPTSDEEAMAESLRRVVAMDEGMVIYPGHGPVTTLRDEKAHNPFLRGLHQ